MDYEIYLEAVNEHGVGEASPRLIFRTQSQVNVLVLICSVPSCSVSNFGIIIVNILKIPRLL